MGQSTQSFLSSGAVNQAQQLANRWPYKPEARPKRQDSKDQIKERNLTLKQTSNELYASECAEYDAGLRSKPPKRLTGEYIRQIENKALAKLKAQIERHNLSLDDLLPKL